MTESKCPLHFGGMKSKVKVTSVSNDLVKQRMIGTKVKPYFHTSAIS